MSHELNPIGLVHSPYITMEDAPRQGRNSDLISEIVILDQYLPGLRDVENHPHLIVLCWFDRADRNSLLATPPHTHTEHGVFATRSPNRPNPIGLCVVDLISCHDGVLKVRGLDAIEGTPVLDIKPFIPEIDCVENVKHESLL